MATEVILPKLGQTMEEGTIVEWLKQEGDAVRRGDVLFTVESDKATLESESPARGFLRKILVPAGVSVPVLTPVAIITRDKDEDISAYLETSRPTWREGGQPPRKQGQRHRPARQNQRRSLRQRRHPPHRLRAASLARRGRGCARESTAWT